MADVVFKYPGAKTQLFSWIESNIPSHHTWVDVFGGSGVVTANKPESEVEVYNDMDGDIVHFFTTLRDNGDELAEWLAQTPHSRELHREYRSNFYNGDKPKNDVERAGQFFYLRFTQFATKYDGVSGYNGDKKGTSVYGFNNAVERLSEWQNRFRSVQIEQLDFEELINRYDGPNTFLYCDPPYMDEGDDLYSHEGFDHKRFVNSLKSAEGDWMVSYTRVPKELREYATTILEQKQRVIMSQGVSDEEKHNVERLVMNYDPNDAPMFRKQAQSGLGAFADT
jgi:DNA adenine methylase